jgi:hypothetical protein
MKIKRGGQAAMSAAIFCGIVLAVMWVDPRVRERFEALVYSSGGVASLDNRAMDVGNALVTAVRNQSIDNAPLMVFAVVGAILFVVWVRA